MLLAGFSPVGDGKVARAFSALNEAPLWISSPVLTMPDLAAGIGVVFAAEFLRFIESAGRITALSQRHEEHHARPFPCAFIRILATAALTVATGLAHVDFTGEMIAVLDGDTADVLVEQRPVRVRLDFRSRADVVHPLDAA